MNGYLSVPAIVGTAATLVLLAGSQTATLAAASTAPARSTTAPPVTATAKTPKPKLAFKPSKRVLVIKTRKGGTLRVVLKSVDGERSKRRMVAKRRATRIALPSDASVVRARTVRPAKSGWARLVVTPATGNPATGTPGTPQTDNNDGDEDSGTPTWDATSPIPTTQYADAVTVLNTARTQGGYCGSAYYGPQPALRVNDDLNAIAAYSVQRYADPWSPPTAPVPPDKSWLQLRKNGAALGRPFDEASVGSALATWMLSGMDCASIHDPAFTDIGVGLAYSYPKIDGQPVGAATHANLTVMLGTP